MILMISYANKDRKHYIVKDFSDLSPIFEAYPKTQRIALYSHSLEDAVNQIADYINNGYTEAWVESGLNKSLREKAAALGLAASMIVNPVNTSHLQDRELTPADQKEQVKKPETNFGTHPADGFLWNLKQIETSGGKNLKHPVIAHGVAKGSRAMGNWGLLKPTVNEIVNRMRLSGNLTPEYAQLAHMDRDKMEDHLKKNPQVELDLVRNLAGHVLKRNKGDMHRAAYAWNTGHNMFPDQIHNDVLLNSSYVQKFKSADQVNPFKTKAKAKAPLAKTVEVETDFKIKIDQWLKVREEQKTKNPTRSSNFQPDPGLLRDSKLDDIKPSSMKTSEEKLKEALKEANKKGK